MNILDAIADPKVFGQHFKGNSWDAWKVFLCALFALPMSAEQLEVFRRHTGRKEPPTQPAREAWLICGRRAGKSYILATIAVFLACFRDWRPLLGPGEFGTIMIVAEDKRQCRAILRFIRGLLRGSPMLAKTIVSETTESVTLKNRIVIEVHACSFRSTRGYTTVAALCDEISVWPSDELSAEPDAEVINSIRPGMATIPEAVLLCASSPHAMRGALWDAYRQHYGHDDSDILVWQATTRDMNATVSQSWVDAQLAKDPARAAADYMAEFRIDVEGFISRESVMQCVVPGLRERPPARGTYCYGFVDPSGGSTDSFTLAIAHNDIARRRVILDAIREIKPPFSPEAVVAELSQLLKSYRVYALSGDHYAKLWPVESFRRHGIRYTQDAQPKSDLYAGSLLPLLNSRRIELFDLPVLINQICQLERSTRHGGADRIDHPARSHDDVVNAVAGVAALCTRANGYNLSHPGLRGLYDDAPVTPPPPTRAERDHAELLARYGAPVSLGPRVADLPAHVREGLERARADVARTRHLPP
jgi:hypothetical protein